MIDERRYYGLDALRGSMMMLGIVLHSAMFYLADPPALMRIPLDHRQSYFFDLIFHFIHSFRMPTFFVLAGFFASLLMERRGLMGTLKNRVARVLAPLLAGMLTVLPVAGLFMMDVMLESRFGVRSVLPDLDLVNRLGAELVAKGLPADQPSLLHLWFLYYLCMFYLALPFLERLVRISLRWQQVIRAMLASPWMMIGFGLITAPMLWPYHGAQVHEGFILLKPHPPSILYYGWFFALGYLFHTWREVLPAMVRALPLAAVLSAVLFPLSLWISNLDNAAAGASVQLHLAAMLVNGLCTWALIYLCVGAALRFFDRASPWILYVAQSSYWVFLLHLPMVCLFGWLILPYNLPAIVKFLFVAGATTLVCFASYHWLVQRTWVSVFLNGRRFNLDWPWRPAVRSATTA